MIDQARRFQVYNYHPRVPFGFDIRDLLVLEQNSSNNNSIEIGQDRFEPPASVRVSIHEMQSCPFNMRSP